MKFFEIIGLENTIFIAVTVLIFGTIIIFATMQWIKNNLSPKLTVNAVVESKQIQKSCHRYRSKNTRLMRTETVISWFVTFSFEGGDSKEFYVKEQDYKKLTEGSNGRLTFQGTRYLDFEKTFRN